MLFKIHVLLCLFLIILLSQSSLCALPENIHNLEVDDFISLWDKFPSFIDKINEAVNRFRCPKGWKRLGGSCYYFSNFTSTTFHANHTCHYLHSNMSRLMQIRNGIELLYAAHILTKNNLQTLMIEIDSNLLRGKQISDVLMKDSTRWKRMKNAFNEVRIRYEKLKRKIVDRLSSTGLRIFRRSKKMKNISSIPEFDENESNMYFYPDNEYIGEHDSNAADSHSFINIEDYDYDELDSADEADEFEQLDDIHGICDDVHWNVFDAIQNSTVYLLTKYNISNRVICSLSEVESHLKYHHICEYVLDYCVANILCGKHGRCVNTLTGFKCACSFIYGGLFCDKITEHGYHIIISVAIICFLAVISIRIVRVVLWYFIQKILKFCKVLDYLRRLICKNMKDDKQNLVLNEKTNIDDKNQQRRQTIVQQLQGIILPDTTNPLLSPVKRNLVRYIWVGGLTITFLTILFLMTTIMYYFSFGYNKFSEHEQLSINDTIRLVTECARISDYRRGNVIFAPFAFALIFLFSWSIKRDTACLNRCDGRPGVIPPIEPFRTANRFTTATVFGILAFEVLKIFEELLFNAGKPLEHAILFELLKRIGLVIIVGLRYYPVLASLQLRNLVPRLLVCVYIIANVGFTIFREGSCMGFLPLSGKYTAFEEAKLRNELGTWFIIYGLFKNVPHFAFLSYISAELCVRFAYDSIYRPLRKGSSIWSSPIVELDESEFAKYYVTKLFRRNHDRLRRRTVHKTKSDDLDDHEHELELQNQIEQSKIKKFIQYFYHFDDDFRFTTMAMCTYMVAVVFLYYLACTFVFLYVTRTTGHFSFLKLYLETTFNVDLGAFSVKNEIIISAILTGLIFAFQLFIGMQNYKKHKIQLYQGIYYEIPPAKNFRPSAIASNSVHYSGFLVGYMAWGFVICFHVILLIFIAFKILSLQIRAIEIVLSIVVPILIIYLLKMLCIQSAGKFLFIPKLDDKLNLRSRKTYAIFVYFSFFADCFIGIASCIIRLIKATLLNIVFMARLDWSFLGRPLERYDIGFAAYVSYLHMEVTYTNPVMLAFCYSLYDDIVKRRPKHCYADECCIAPSELDSDMNIDKLNPTTAVIYRRIDNSPTKKPIVSTRAAAAASTQNKRLQSKSLSNEEQSTTSTTPVNVSTGFRPPVPRRDDISSTEDLLIVHDDKPSNLQEKETNKPKTTDTSAQQMSVYYPPSYNAATNTSNVQTLRSISYRNAQQQTPPLTLNRSHMTNISTSSTNQNDDSTHYSEITNASSQPSVSNPMYSKMTTVETISHSTNQPKQDGGDDTDEMTDEEDCLLDQETVSVHDQSTESPDDVEKQRIRKRKQLRFRWFLLYTLIRNYRLFDLRKDIPGRLTRLHLQRSVRFGEQPFSQPTIQVEEREIMQPQGLEIDDQPARPEPEFQRAISTVSAQTGSSQAAHVQSPSSPTAEYPSSPAERYMAIRAQMLYDANTQQPTIVHVTTPSHPPTTTSGHIHQTLAAMGPGASGGSLGFRPIPDTIVQPPSSISAKSRGAQVPYMTPSGFREAPPSTAGYPLDDASVANVATYRTQMSLDQHLQLWRQGKIDKIQKKNRHCYAYDVSSPQMTNDKISTAAILAPQTITPAPRQQQVPPTPITATGRAPRMPTISPFEYPKHSIKTAPSVTSTTASEHSEKKTRRRKSKTPRPTQNIPPTPPPRMDPVDEDPQETSTVTTALIHHDHS